MCDRVRLYEDIDYVTEELQSGEYVEFPRERGFVFSDGSVIELSWGEDHRIIGQWDECDIVTYMYSGGEADVRVNGRMTIPQKSVLTEWLETISPPRIVIDYYRDGKYIAGKTFEFVDDAVRFLNEIYYNKVRGGLKMSSVKRTRKLIKWEPIRKRAASEDDSYLSKKAEKKLRVRWRRISEKLKYITSVFETLQDKYKNNIHNRDYGTSKWTWEFNVKFLDNVDYPDIVDNLSDSEIDRIVNSYIDQKLDEFLDELNKLDYVKYYVDDVGIAGRSGGWLVIVDNMADELDDELCSPDYSIGFLGFLPNPECENYDKIDDVVKTLKEGVVVHGTVVYVDDQDVEDWYADASDTVEKWETYINEAQAGLDAISDLVDKYLNQMTRELSSEKFWKEYIEEE